MMSAYMGDLPDYAQALEMALRAAAPLSREQDMEVEGAGGWALAEAVTADRDLPPFDRAMMDGYAIRASDFVAGMAWPVAHEIAAGAPPDVQVPSRSCVAIATGAALPADLDTVIPHEWSDRAKPVRFTVNSVTCGHAVHKRGSDASAGAILIAAGAVLGAHHLGIAGAAGRTAVKVKAKPRAAILTSGDEVMPAGTPLSKLQPHQIRNSNGPMAVELLRRFGAEPVQSRHLADDRHSTVAVVQEDLEQVDLLITIGGVSVGDRDHFPAAFQSNGIEAMLHGASIQPGRPIFVGRSPNGTTVIGLPGNPVSVLACACLFAWPIVRTMLGLDAALPWRRVELAAAVKPNPLRRAFRPALLQNDGKARVPSWAGSGDLAHTAPTHGLIELPPQTEPVTEGAMLRFLPWP